MRVIQKLMEFDITNPNRRLFLGYPVLVVLAYVAVVISLLG